MDLTDLLLDSVVTRKIRKKSKCTKLTFSNVYNSAIFKAMDLKFCMEVHLDNL